MLCLNVAEVLHGILSIRQNVWAFEGGPEPWALQASALPKNNYRCQANRIEHHEDVGNFERLLRLETKDENENETGAIFSQTRMSGATKRTKKKFIESFLQGF